VKLNDDLGHYLASRGQTPVEGSSSVEQQNYLSLLVEQTQARVVAEVGFNAGFSSVAFLRAGAHVVSFDLGVHQTVPVAKEFIDRHYPGRLELILGDSTITVPAYATSHPGLTFDIVFIDGGHDYTSVSADIANFKPLTHPATSIVADDLTPWLPWGAGPTRAWQEAVAGGIIVPMALYKDGQRVETITPPGQRVWARGRYA